MAKDKGKSLDQIEAKYFGKKGTKSRSEYDKMIENVIAKEKARKKKLG